MQDLRVLMSYSDPRAATMARRLQRIARVGTIFFVPLYVAGLIAAGVGLVRVWQTGDWQHLWEATRSTSGYVWFVIFIPLLGAGNTTRSFRDIFPTLERAAATGDGRLAPLATYQPEPSAYAELGDISVTLGPLRYLDDWAAPYQVFAGCALAVLLGMALVLALLAGAGIAFLWLPATTPGMPTVQIVVSLLLAVMCGGLLWLVVWGGRQVRNSRSMTRRLRAGLRIQADAEGLRWVEARSGEEQSLLWREARAFYLVAPQDEPAHGYGAPASLGGVAGVRAAEGMHVLAGGQTRLIWTTPTPSEPDAQVEHQQLCRLIATHSRLPLRDLSTASATIAGALRTTTNGQALPPDERMALDALGLPLDMNTVERVRRRTRRVFYFALALLVPYVLVPLIGVVGSILQHVGIG